MIFNIHIFPSFVRSFQFNSIELMMNTRIGNWVIDDVRMRKIVRKSSSFQRGSIAIAFVDCFASLRLVGVLFSQSFSAFRLTPIE